MEHFELDVRLEKDNYILGELQSSVVLLMNNKVAPWFILVPKVAGVSELYELDSKMQVALMSDINHVSIFLKQHYSVDKLNVAAIGNIVKQLHVHVVVRKEGDSCWPGVVWGADFSEPYQAEEVNELIGKMTDKLTGFVTDTSTKY